MDQQDSYPQQPQYQPTGPTPYPVTPAHKTVRRRTAILIGAGALILGAGIGSAGANSKTAATAGAPAATATTTRTVAAPAPTGAAPVTVTAKAAAAPAPPAVTKTVTITKTAPAPSSAPATGFGDGTYVVGTDIKAGMYKTTGPAPDSAGCYWQRDRDLAGGIDSIVDNGIANGPTTVQIASSDKAFETNGCAAWVKIG